MAGGGRITVPCVTHADSRSALNSKDILMALPLLDGR